MDLEDVKKELYRAMDEVHTALGINNITWDGLTTGPGVISGISHFVNAVNWNQPFFYGLGCFHLAVLFTAVKIRHSPEMSFAFFISVAITVLCASYINDAAREHRTALGLDENYFDKNGIFISAVFSGPLVLITFVMHVYLMFQAAKLAIVVKQKQLKVEARRRGKEAGAVTDKEKAE